MFLFVQLTWNEISGFILKFIIKVSDELTLSTQVCLLHWKMNPSRRFTICFIQVGFRRNNCHSRVSGELKMEQEQYSWFATTWQGGHVGVQYNIFFSGRIYMKIEFTSQRKCVFMWGCVCVWCTRIVSSVTIVIISSTSIVWMVLSV